MYHIIPLSPPVDSLIFAIYRVESHAIYRWGLSKQAMIKFYLLVIFVKLEMWLNETYYHLAGARQKQWFLFNPPEKWDIWCGGNQRSDGSNFNKYTDDLTIIGIRNIYYRPVLNQSKVYNIWYKLELDFEKKNIWHPELIDVLVWNW